MSAPSTSTELREVLTQLGIRPTVGKIADRRRYLMIVMNLLVLLKDEDIIAVGKIVNGLQEPPMVAKVEEAGR